MLRSRERENRLQLLRKMLPREPAPTRPANLGSFGAEAFVQFGQKDGGIAMDIVVFFGLAAAVFGWLLFTEKLLVDKAILLAEKASREAYIRELEQRCGERDPEQDGGDSNG